MTKDQNFDLFVGPNWPKNWASEAHILHTSKSSCNEHMKQYWCETNGKFLRKWPKTAILTYLGAQSWPKNWASEAHILYTSKISCNEHMKQYWYETSGKFIRKWPKTRILTYAEAQSGPKLGSLRPILYTPLILVPISIWSNNEVKLVENFWEN